jgi:peroxiredoxin (alkyl hydroperoxide reductase subunit C)
MTIEVGSTAPDFTLPDYNKEQVSLSDFRGSKNVLLVFYPFAFSGICQGELCQVRDDLNEFQNDDVQVLGVSVDSPFALKAWSEQQNFAFPLLSDFWPHGAVAKLYGVFNDTAGMANRGTFVINRQGEVRFAEVNQPGEARDQQVWKKVLSELSA